jgi:hypothetical protein
VYCHVWTATTATKTAAAGGLLMSRGAQPFKQGDVTKIIKAVVKAGVKDWRIEIAEGKIVVVATEPASASGTDHEETSADIRKLL